MLDQIKDTVGYVTAGGAYDGHAVYDVVLRCHPQAGVIIRPRSAAVVSDTATSQRDEHLKTIEQQGQIGWRLHARNAPNQKTDRTEMNRMTRLGMLVPIVSDSGRLIIETGVSYHIHAPMPLRSQRFTL